MYATVCMRLTSGHSDFGESEAEPLAVHVERNTVVAFVSEVQRSFMIGLGIFILIITTDHPKPSRKLVKLEHDGKL